MLDASGVTTTKEAAEEKKDEKAEIKTNYPHLKPGENYNAPIRLTPSYAIFSYISRLLTGSTDF